MGRADEDLIDTMSDAISSGQVHGFAVSFATGLHATALYGPDGLVLDEADVEPGAGTVRFGELRRLSAPSAGRVPFGRFYSCPPADDGSVRYGTNAPFNLHSCPFYNN